MHDRRTMRNAVHTALCWLGFAIPLLFCACHGQQHQQMLALLNEADSLNRAYAPLPSDTLLLEAADFFDRHGSSNERLRAHYLLGCAYRDMGDAPRALQCYLDAVDRADTLSHDCNHSLLCRVFAQMAGLYYEQNLMEHSLRALDLSVSHASAAKDSDVVLNSLAHKMGCYERLGMTDSVKAVCDYLFDSIYVCQGRKDAARYLGTAIKSYLISGDIAKARKVLDVYEQESGFFGNDNNIEHGREAYYFLKGKYYQAVGKLDSAEFYFRRELKQGRDFNNQNMASRALSLLFDNQHKADSAAKYAIYSYAMNDSAYSCMTIQELQHVKGMYDYSRYERQAYIEKIKTGRYRKYLTILLVLFVNAIFISFVAGHRQYQKRKEENKSYLQLLHSLNKTKHELESFKEHETILSQHIAEKEKELEVLRKEFQLYKSKQPASFGFAFRRKRIHNLCS